MEIAGPVTPGQVRGIMSFSGVVEEICKFCFASLASEFGVVLVYFYTCDRTNLFGESSKVLFVMYHYFAAKEIYNAIRKRFPNVLCACDTSRSGKPDAQPRRLLSLVPDYPMLNFMLNTIIYVAVRNVAHRVFDLTNRLKVVFIPTRDNKRLLYNLITGAIVSLTLYALSMVLLSLTKKLVRIAKCLYCK
ncbi:hypothetical protein B296_00002265 [Ensete ventricosum]|uniref:Cas1p 10 TM acyl transferase domain-containing protein n=1 Tax=Ensete ventricosum TaxID=4639 RepID=A0A427AK44_ENSVE|nr:hypothetical protein B296_00002265 [Ensete ventricosum]